MSRRRLDEQAAQEERASAIRRCRRCDEAGWKLGTDRTPIDPAIRCRHGATPAVRDITEPIHDRQERLEW